VTRNRGPSNWKSPRGCPESSPALESGPTYKSETGLASGTALGGLQSILSFVTNELSTSFAISAVARPAKKDEVEQVEIECSILNGTQGIVLDVGD